MERNSIRNKLRARAIAGSGSRGLVAGFFFIDRYSILLYSQDIKSPKGSLKKPNYAKNAGISERGSGGNIQGKLANSAGNSSSLGYCHCGFRDGSRHSRDARFFLWVSL